MFTPEQGRRMGIVVLPVTGRWDDFASFMVPRKPGGRGCVCIAYRNSSLDMSRLYRAHARAVRERTGSRGPGVRRWLVLGRAEVHLPRPGQLPGDPACPGRGRVVGALLRGAAGVPAPRAYAPAAGGSGRARARDGRDRAGRLPGRPWQRAHRPDQRLREHRPALRGTQIQARPPDRRPGAATSPAGSSVASFPDLARSLPPEFAAVLSLGALPASRGLARREPAAFRGMLAASFAN